VLDRPIRWRHMELKRDGFTIYYEVAGRPDRPLLVLVAGLGEQIGSVEFPDEHVRLFVDAGFRVLRLDDRDIGLSLPDEDKPPPYSWLDMADDIVAVIEAVGANSAHLVGASMGGYLVRWAAVRHPQRVASLSVVMSGSGADADDHGPQVSPEVLTRLYEGLAVRKPRDAAIQATVDIWRWCWASEYPFEEDWVRGRVEHAHGRSYRAEHRPHDARLHGRARAVERAEHHRLPGARLPRRRGSVLRTRLRRGHRGAHPRYPLDAPARHGTHHAP
jgi:pimeloyl-ACP methyl ester carboxylesterase